MENFGAWEVIVVLVFGATFVLGSLGAGIYLYKRRKQKADLASKQDMTSVEGENKSTL